MDKSVLAVAMVLTTATASPLHSRSSGYTPLPPSPEAIKLQSGLEAAVTQRQRVFTIPSGVYAFNNASLNVEGAEGLTLDFEPKVELWFAVGAGILVRNSHGVVIQGRGLVVDYSPLPYFQATAVSGVESAGDGGASIEVRIDPGSLTPPDFWQSWGSSPTNEFVQGPVWWSGSAKGVGGASFPLKSQGFSGISLSDFKASGMPGQRLFTYTPVAGFRPPIPQAGDKLTAIVRIGYTLLLLNSSGCILQDIDIHTASFMAITEFDGAGGNVYTNVNVVRRAGGGAGGNPQATSPSTDATVLCGPNHDRVCMAAVSSNGDVFHSSGCKVGPVIKRCEFSYALDDFVNVHTRTQVVCADRSRSAQPARGLGSEASPTRTLVIADPRLKLDRHTIDDHPYGTVETMPNVREGDTLSFRAVETLALVCTATVSSIMRIPFSDSRVAAAQAFVDAQKVAAGHKFNPIDVWFTTRAGTNESRVWQVGVEVDVHKCNSSLTGLMVNAEAWSNSGAVLDGNYFHSSIDGIRWKSSNGRITNNRWEPAVSLTGLEVTPLRSYYEGPFGISNVTISGNVFVGGSPKLITECTGMSHHTKPGVWVSCTDIKITNNSFPPDPGS